MIKRAICAVLCLVLCLSIGIILPLQARAVDMKVSDACVELIKQLEGFTAIPTWDYAQWTVGYGTSCPENLVDRYKENGIPISDAEQLLAEKLVYFDECVNRFIDKHNLKLTQGQYDAVFSLTYNCGASWLNKSEGQLYQAIVNGTLGNEFIGALSAWCTAGGNFLHGLMMRRLAEAQMYLYGQYDTAVPDYYCYVKFDANGGQRSAAGQGYDSRYAAPVMPTATYPGYRFLGWFTEPSGGTQVTNLEKSHDRITLYAHWEKNDAPSAPEQEVTVTITTNNLNIRSGAGTGYDVVSQVHSGDQLKILRTAAVEGELWGQCDQGWICLTYTDYNLVISGGSVNEKVMATITTSAVNVRSGPGASYGRVTTLHGGDRVEILEQRTVDGRIWGRYEQGWFRISGYASVEVVGGSTGGSSQTPGYTPVGPTGPGTPPVDNPNPTFPKADVELPQAPNQALILGKNAVVIRTGPHKSYPEVGQYGVQSRVEVLEFRYFMGDVWARTDKGWFCMHRDVLLQADNPLTKTFSVTITIKSLYVRTGPGTDYQYVKTVKKDAVVEIFAIKETDDGVWGRLDVGWISLKHTNFQESMIPDQTPKPDCSTTGHSYVTTVKNPTCTEGGYSSHVCSACGHSYTDGETAALGHKYTSVVTSPTATAQGYTTHTCDNCGHSYKDSYTDAQKPETEVVNKTYATITAGTVNVRKGAGASYGAVTVLRRGARVEILEQKEVDGRIWGRYEKGWFRISGYATLETVREEVEVSKPQQPSEPEKPAEPEKPSEPEQPAEPEKPETTKKTYAIITAGAVNVRNGAGASYSAVGILRKGDKVEIYEQKDVDGRIWGRCDKGWFRMSGGYATLETVEG